MPLLWLQSDLTGEGVDSELLDDLEDVDFAMKLRKRVFLKKLFSFWLHFAATEVPIVEKFIAIAAPVSVSENLPLGNGLLHLLISVLCVHRLLRVESSLSARSVVLLTFRSGRVEFLDQGLLHLMFLDVGD